MFKIAEKEELSQISLTGVRSLLLLWLLIKSPRTLDEIRDEFIKLNIMEPSHSNDILRIDLNTLRAMGCEITHATAKSGFKYILKKHPFSLNITSEEILLLKKVYKKVKDKSNILLLIKYDELFKKIAEHITDETIKEQLYGLSVLKNFETEFIKKMVDDCRDNNTLKLIYCNPGTKEEAEKDIVAQKLVCQNDKIYLWGYDLFKKEAVTLNVKRIKSILSRKPGSGSIEFNKTCVKFFLKNFGITDIDEDETIIETSNDGVLVEDKYHNDFVAMQRILSLGADCIVQEPLEFRAKIIQKLKDMRKIYND